MTEYALSAELDPAHQQDVKDVLAISDDRIASCSRDGSVAIWDKSEGGRSFQLKALLNGHHAYVNSLAHVPGSFRGDLLASGGNSSLILLHSLSTLEAEPVLCLIGHALNVCVLSYSVKHKELISGSWDKTARVWKAEEGEWRTKLVLEGHTQAVWGVVGIEDGKYAGGYLTGSADQLVMLWNDKGEAISHIKGYPEPVRSLVILPEPDLFASGCNDGVVRISDMSGKVVSTLQGHKDSVFQLTNGLDGAVVSCGEDHTARVWNDRGEKEAVLKHPCQTVWAVSVLPNGDVVTAGSDGRVRVWTSDETRYASSAIRAAYENEVIEAMKVTASAQAPRAAPEEARDIVIDIDISDDAEPLKLHFRTDGDSRNTAEEFVKQHDLPTSYIDRIDEFIRAHI